MENYQQENEQLKEELTEANEKIEALKEKLGSWRRKAENRPPRLQGAIRQGFDQQRKVHYQVYIVNVPQDLEMKEILKEIYLFLQTVKPYLFSRMDYSQKYDGYLIQVEQSKNWDLNKGFFKD